MVDVWGMMLSLWIIGMLGYQEVVFFVIGCILMFLGFFKVYVEIVDELVGGEVDDVEW